MHCEPPAITLIPCEEHFRPVLPTIEGNVDYLTLREQLTLIDQLLRDADLELEVLQLSGEEHAAVISLEELRSDKQQKRFQEHSVRALRCNLVRTLLGGS